MKKTLKMLLLVAIIFVSVLALTGCGNKLIATKEFEATETTPKHKEETVISFKNDKISSVKMTFTFDNKDETKKYVEEYNAMVQLFKTFSEEENLNLPELKQNGKKATMTLDAKTYAEILDNAEYANKTREEIKETLEKEGYTVK